MQERREFMPIDETSVKLGTYDNYGSKIPYARGRGKYEGVVFIHTGSYSPDKAYEYLELNNKGVSSDQLNDFVVGVGINREVNTRIGKIVYDHQKLGIWRTPFWEIDQETLNLLGVDSNNLHPLNKRRY